MRSWPNETFIQKTSAPSPFGTIEEFGGTDGVREEGLLESALASPFQTFGGEAVYPSLQAKASQLGFSLVCNHPFLDGNKRIGVHIMLVFWPSMESTSIMNNRN